MTVLRHAQKDLRFPAPIVLPVPRPVTSGDFHIEMVVDFSRVSFRDDDARLFQERLRRTVKRPQSYRCAPSSLTAQCRAAIIF